MNYFRTFSKLAVCGIAAAAWLMAALPSNAAQRYGEAKVESVTGSAQYTRSGANAAITTGMTLIVGDTITTSAGATVVLDLGQAGGKLSVTSGSELTLTKLDLIGEDAAETELFLAKGKVAGKTKKVAAASKYEIKTPTSVAGIRGTDFSVSADGTVTVLSGTVLVVYIINGRPTPPQAVTAGNSFKPGDSTPKPSTTAQVTAAQSALISIPGGDTTTPGGPNGPVLPPTPPPTIIVPIYKVI